MASGAAVGIVAVLAGILYGAGWWILIDVFWVLDTGSLLAWYHLVPAFVSVLGTVIVFACPRKAIFSKAGSSFLDSDASTSAKRASFFIGVMATLLGPGIAILLAVMGYDAARAPLTSRGYAVSGNAPLFALIVAGAAMAVSTFAFKFGRPLPSENDGFF